jgi:hypothetical protein
MSPLNDDELNFLLKQAKSKPPEPRPELTLRALRAYRENVARRPHWRRLLLRPVPLRLPVGILAAVLLILIGAAGDRAFRRPSVVGQAPLVEVPVTREHVVYRNCPAGQQESGPSIASLTFKEFQPVREIKPRVVRSIRDDQ